MTERCVTSRSLNVARYGHTHRCRTRPAWRRLCMVLRAPALCDVDLFKRRSSGPIAPRQADGPYVPRDSTSCVCRGGDLIFLRTKPLPAKPAAVRSDVRRASYVNKQRGRSRSWGFAAPPLTQPPQGGFVNRKILGRRRGWTDVGLSRSASPYRLTLLDPGLDLWT